MSSAMAAMLITSVGAMIILVGVIMAIGRPWASETPLSPAEPLPDIEAPAIGAEAASDLGQEAPGEIPEESASQDEAPQTGGSARTGSGGSEPVAPPVDEPPVEQPVVAAISPSDAEQVLFDLLERLDADPTVAVLSAVRDTAELVYDLPGLASADRAFAAYILGNALLPLGDTIGSVNWLEQAVRLRPDGPGYQLLLDTHRQLLSP